MNIGVKIVRPDEHDPSFGRPSDTQRVGRIHLTMVRSLDDALDFVEQSLKHHNISAGTPFALAFVPLSKSQTEHMIRSSFRVSDEDLKVAMAELYPGKNQAGA